MRLVLRCAAALAVLSTSLVLSPGQANAAGTCMFDPHPQPVIGDLDPIYYPVLGPSEQPAITATPVAVSTTQTGPAYKSCEVSWWRVRKGGKLTFANVTSFENDGSFTYGSERFWGPGFDSGVVPLGGVAEVVGINQLAEGWYDVYNITGRAVGYLLIDPQCPTQCVVDYLRTEVEGHIG